MYFCIYIFVLTRRFTFGPKESETFSNALTHVSLPGLNNLDQMYLMALANTVANTQTDFSDRFTDTKQSTAGIVLYTYIHTYIVV